MKLSELSACGRSYAMTRYDASLSTLRLLGPEIDPSNEAQRLAMITWLNAWGCRQFAKAHHATASDSLARWSSSWLERLPGPAVELTDLAPSEIALCAASYADLRDRRASIKQRSTGQVSVGFGPTGAAKTLFAIRPRIFAPWDIPIRKARRWSGDAVSFQAYLTDMADQLRMLSAEAGVPVSALPALVGRPDSSPPKLIDEYNWMTLTQGWTPRSVNQ